MNITRSMSQFLSGAASGSRAPSIPGGRRSSAAVGFAPDPRRTPNGAPRRSRCTISVG